MATLSEVTSTGWAEVFFAVAFYACAPIGPLVSSQPQDTFFLTRLRRLNSLGFLYKAPMEGAWSCLATVPLSLYPALFFRGADADGLAAFVAADFDYTWDFTILTLFLRFPVISEAEISFPPVQKVGEFTRFRSILFLFGFFFCLLIDRLVAFPRIILLYALQALFLLASFRPKEF